uniref:Uncharacterized protein n=1 Tax=Helianthus annuus TaxID=4232 RepID=A0A251UYI7_HELAN
MDFLKLICPNSPYIWDGNGVSRCVNDIYPLSYGNLCYINDQHNKKTHTRCYLTILY